MARYIGARRAGCFESLEQRQLLAGDVLVSVVNGTLVVEGDEVDNQIVITSGAEAGAFVVTGLEGTTITQEGQAAASAVTVTDVRNIRVSLGDGNDVIAVAGATVRGSLSINGGLGDDEVHIASAEAAELAGELAEEAAVTVRGALNIRTDGGADQVSVDAATVGRLNVHVGDDNDIVTLGSMTAVPGEDGEDAAARLSARGGVHVNLGEGDDEVALNQVDTRGAILLRGGSGDNTIAANAVSTAALMVFGGDGVDDVTLDGLDTHHLGIHTGAGDDVVEARDSVFKSIGVSLGDGGDTLTTAGLQARVAILSGGGAEDTLDVQEANDFAREVVRGFETPPDVNTNTVANGRRLLSRLLGRLR